MKMHRVFASEIRAPVSQVWALLTDTQMWPIWGPTVRAVDFPERFIHAGAKGRIRTPLGIWVPFAIEDFEPDSYWDWKVGGVSATGHRVERTGPEHCRLSFYVPRSALGYGIVCRLALRRIQRLFPKQ